MVLRLRAYQNRSISKVWISWQHKRNRMELIGQKKRLQLWLSPTPLKNDGVRQLGWWNSQLNVRITIFLWVNPHYKWAMFNSQTVSLKNVPKHQPAATMISWTLLVAKNPTCGRKHAKNMWMFVNNNDPRPSKSCQPLRTQTGLLKFQRSPLSKPQIGFRSLII